MSELPPDEGREPHRDAPGPPVYAEYTPGVTEPSHSGAVLRGFAQGCALHLIQVPLCTLIGLIFGRSGSGPFVGLVTIMAIGITQFLYLGPAIARARKRGQRGREQGLWLCAALTALLNGLCYAVVFWPGRRWAG